MTESERPEANEEQLFFRAFRALRERAVEVSRGFRDAVSGRLDQPREDQSVGLGALLASLTVELLNAASDRGEHEDQESEAELAAARASAQRTTSAKGDREH